MADLTDEFIAKLYRTMESIIWTLRPQVIRGKTTQEQTIWLNKIVLEIITGERRDG